MNQLQQVLVVEGSVAMAVTDRSVDLPFQVIPPRGSLIEMAVGLAACAAFRKP